MRLQACDLDAVAVLMNPLVIKSPEPVWTTARESKMIPEALYGFYCIADYFSYGNAPRFLSDKSGVLFPYLGNLVRGIRDSFEEAEELYRDIQKHHARSYSPAKKVKKESWDPRAAHQVRRSFRNLVVVLTGILDQFAEITALFFYGEMDEIKVGRAMFTDLLKFAKKPSPPIEIIATPRRAHLHDLHLALASELIRTGPDKDWAELLFLYQNKMAHMGNFTFWWHGVPHKTDGEFYMFLPNHWPHIPQEQITKRSSTSPIEPNAMREFAEESFIHQDLIEYLEKLIVAVGNVIDRGFGILTASYNTLRDCEPLHASVESLRSETKSPAFKYFP